jgi:uncharacterized membrane protein
MIGLEPCAVARLGSTGRLIRPCMNTLLRSGRWIFCFAIIALAVQTIVCFHRSLPSLGTNTHCIPALPFLPAVPWIAILFGVLWIACGTGLLVEHWRRASALILGFSYIFWTLVHTLPKYIALPGDMGLRTVVFEPLALACIAFLLPGPGEVSAWLTRASRIVVAVAMIVFGVDHFLGLAFIGSLLPGWIPWHQFWVAVFGVVFIAGGVGIGVGILERWSWAAIGLMFAVWVITLHLPRTLGFYSVPGAITDPNEWSSLFIAIGLWGGPWAIAAAERPGTVA